MELIAVLLLLAIIVVLAIVFWITVSLLGLIITIVVAGIIGWAADKVTPGELPYGVFGAIGAGLLGALLGGIIFDGFGPEIGGLSIIPAFIGAVIVALAVEAFGIGRERTAT